MNLYIFETDIHIFWKNSNKEVFDTYITSKNPKYSECGIQSCIKSRGFVPILISIHINTVYSIVYRLFYYR